MVSAESLLLPKLAIRIAREGTVLSKMSDAAIKRYFKESKGADGSVDDVRWPGEAIRKQSRSIRNSYMSEGSRTVHDCTNIHPSISTKRIISCMVLQFFINQVKSSLISVRELEIEPLRLRIEPCCIIIQRRNYLATLRIH